MISSKNSSNVMQHTATKRIMLLSGHLKTCKVSLSFLIKNSQVKIMGYLCLCALILICTFMYKTYIIVCNKCLTCSGFHYYFFFFESKRKCASFRTSWHKKKSTSTACVSHKLMQDSGFGLLVKIFW